MYRQTAVGFILLLFVSTAYAYSCPGLMSDVDAALGDDAVVAGLSDDELDRVRDLRDEGEQLHQQGDHDGSEDALHEAKSILGID